MSFLQENLETYTNQQGLCMTELVAGNLSVAQGEQYLSPLLNPECGTPLSYYGKPIAITTEETKGLRKLTRLFNKLSSQGYIPNISTENQAIEWGKPDGMRLAFLPLLNAFVHAKEFNLGKEDAESTASKDERVYVTGTCMYGKNGVIGKTDTGKSLSLVDPYITPTATYEEYGCITSLEFEEDFHIYEVFEALSRGNILNGINADKIFFNVPIVPYVLYAKDAVSRGIMESGLIDEWVQNLKKRAAQLASYEQSICQGKVIPVDPLYPYLDYISAPQTTLADICNMLSKQDAWWKSYLEKVPAQKFADIGSASYARAYYDLLGNNESSRVVIAVEDQTEMRILLELKKLIESGIVPNPNQNSSVIGLYPFTPIIFPDSDGQANATFFCNNPEQNASMDAVFNICARFANKDLVAKAKAAYVGLKSIEQNNTIQFNLTQN